MILGREIAAWIESEGSFVTGFDLYVRADGGEYTAELRRYAQQQLVTEEQYQLLVKCLNAKLEEYGCEVAVSQQADPDEETPDVIKALEQRGRQLKKQESDLHGRIKALAEQPNPQLHKEELYTWAREMIIDIQPALDDTYGQIRAWKKEGKLPVPGAERLIQETVAKMKRYENMRTRVSRLKKWINNPKTPRDKRQKYTTELAEKGAEMKAIAEELNL